MLYIYMDNFRGFTDTIIPIKKVNFLVGENSTGKTSFLSLIERLSNTDFWFSEDFNSESYEYGGFIDIVSAESANKDVFTIGYYDDSQTKDKRGSKCCIMSFRSVDGVPSISQYTQATNEWIGSIKVHRNIQQYRVDKTDDSNSAIEANCFVRKVVEFANDTANQYQMVPSEVKLDKRITLAYFTDYLELLATDTTWKEHKRFTYPGIRAHIATLSPIRTKPKRTYDGYMKKISSEGEHIPFLIKKYISRKTNKNLNKSLLERFGNESGLFKKVSIHSYGRGSTSPFEVQVTLDEKPLRIDSVGYGVSQVLPVVVEMILRSNGTTLSIQQPEVHLHPRAQAALGDFIFSMSREQNKSFLVETHSDYLIDRFRLNYREQEGPDSQVLFFERCAGGNKVTSLPIASNGDYPEDQPESFRGFFLDEQRRILGL